MLSTLTVKWRVPPLRMPQPVLNKARAVAPVVSHRACESEVGRSAMVVHNVTGGRAHRGDMAHVAV